MSWIKVRTDLHEDPAVLSMAATLDIPEVHIVGCLVRFWSWADQQTVDGNASGVTGSWLDRFVGVPGFTAALSKAGWLVSDEAGLHIPKFDRHMSQSAKTRALTSTRVSRHRCNASSVTQTLPEKIREEYIHPLPPQGGEGRCATGSSNGSGSKEPSSNGHGRRPSRDAALALVIAAIAAPESSKPALRAAWHPDIEAAVQRAGGLQALGHLHEQDFRRAFHAAYRLPAGYFKLSQDIP
jgi:hypothetical protein